MERYGTERNGLPLLFFGIWRAGESLERRACGHRIGFKLIPNSIHLDDSPGGEVEMDPFLLPLVGRGSGGNIDRSARIGRHPVEYMRYDDEQLWRYLLPTPGYICAFLVDSASMVIPER